MKHFYQPLRGGSWYYQPTVSRASYCSGRKLSARYEFYGFRCALIVWRRQ